MPSPFPGMDPYLEKPGLWPDVHHTLISGIQGLLNAQLRPKYVLRIEERTYTPDGSEASFAPQFPIPDLKFDEEINEAFLTVIDRETRDVVTVIEILSPTNKVP